MCCRQVGCGGEKGRMRRGGGGHDLKNKMHFNCICLDPEKFKEFKLVKRTQLSHTVAKFRFELPTPTSVLGLPIGQHISCRCILKGRMCHHFREMREGDYLAVKGPKVARAILENPKDTTTVHWIYANVTYEDILLKEELDGLVANYPDRFKIFYVLNQPPEVWSDGVGFVSKEMIQTHCPAPAPDIQILRCGPPPMNKAMPAHLEALGYTPRDAIPILTFFWYYS
ncbi:hypothetical protein RND71_040453 [Anisodus tanguticus]|uniref:Cytochrome-b5 reductase n=1 Tax=Anisodus tanguticus TaxID=243964 RepID=A0AAE1QT10_9SOLA|nr:hypothetical protein RND71_040453 [Anisodus tanguticus]